MSWRIASCHRAAARGFQLQMMLGNASRRHMGFPLRASVRQKIFEATVSFLLFAQSEQAALPISVAREHIERVKKSAADFFKTTLENSQDSAWDAPIVCSTRILKQKHRSRIFQNISSA
jgi:hypothetical protein